MTIEEEIFRKSKICFDKLLPYGFIKKDNKYIITKNIIDNSFRIELEINEKEEVKGKIFDNTYNDEYIIFRFDEQTSEFVSRVREEFKSFLLNIKNNCTIDNYFISKQANRLAKLIKEKYNDDPDFLWDDLIGSGVFRNFQNKKWYGLIMNIPKNKIDNGEELVDVLNVKLDEEEIEELLNHKGFYKAYHMNKRTWITIILDETLSDSEIMTYIIKSHKYTEILNEWLIPANPQNYDMLNCFQNTDTIMWKQSSSINVGDYAYLYIGSPFSAIFYKCCVVENNIPFSYSDNNLSINKAMRLKLVKEYDHNKFTLAYLKQFGVNSIRGPRRIPEKLCEELNE